MRQAESKSTRSNGGFNPIRTAEHATNREQRIAEMAYFIAESRGFEGDHALDDWLKAETEVNQKHAENTGEHVLL